MLQSLTNGGNMQHCQHDCRWNRNDDCEKSRHGDEVAGFSPFLWVLFPRAFSFDHDHVSFLMNGIFLLRRREKECENGFKRCFQQLYCKIHSLVCLFETRFFILCASFFRKRNSNSSKYTGQNSKKLSVLLAFLSFFSHTFCQWEMSDFFLLIHYF